MNVRKIAVDILVEVLHKGAYSNIILGRELNKHFLEDKDRALVTEIVYGTIKYKYTIDSIIKFFTKDKFKKMDIFILNLLRISIYQIKYLDKIPSYAVVNEAVNISKKISIGASKFVNGVLRNFLRQKDSTIFFKGDNIAKLAFDYSFEPWMVKFFIKQYGEDKAIRILEGLNSVPDVTVRVNRAKSDYNEVWSRLENLGYLIEKGFVSPEAIKIKRGRNIEKNDLFIDGFITVQDESAMLVSPLMEPKEGMTILDMCSAPGGKTTHISEIINDKGKVLAFDVHEGKLKLIKDNAERLGLKNIQCFVKDAQILDEELIEIADRVLIDAPCSGLGIIRKKPEIKWNKSFKDLEDLSLIQKNILMNGAKYLKKSGILVYSTCTLNKKENEDIINWFLKENKNFILEKIYIGNADNIVYTDDGMVTILPTDKMDGFFIAKLRKIM